MLNRLRNALENKGLPSRGFFAKLAKDTGYSSASMSVAFKTDTISDKLLRTICSTYGINEDWVKTGEGQTFLKKSLDFNDTEAMAESLKRGDAGFTHEHAEIPPPLDRDLLSKAMKAIDRLAEAMPLDAKVDLVDQYYRDLYGEKYKDDEKKG